MNKLTVRKLHKPPYVEKRTNSIPRRGISTSWLCKLNLLIYLIIQVSHIPMGFVKCSGKASHRNVPQFARLGWLRFYQVIKIIGPDSIKPWVRADLYCIKTFRICKKCFRICKRGFGICKKCFRICKICRICKNGFWICKTFRLRYFRQKKIALLLYPETAENIQ